ncbi:hypothetical protein QE152_g5840 [Popillia japonica]|uniref:Uncharacterized protein n=1 Tax=Popillia japonica TaxID=7064 RepID=A0AAW1MH04_POPJA
MEQLQTTTRSKLRVLPVIRLGPIIKSSRKLYNSTSQILDANIQKSYAGERTVFRVITLPQHQHTTKYNKRTLADPYGTKDTEGVKSSS